jgi:hypothetical protein
MCSINQQVLDFKEQTRKHLIEYVESNPEFFTEEESKHWEEFCNKTSFPNSLSAIEMTEPDWNIIDFDKYNGEL